MPKILPPAIAFVLLISSGYFGYRYWQLRNQLAVQTNQPVNKIREQTSTPPDETENWETYIDNTNNISFQYPPYLDTFISSKQFTVSVKTVKQIQDEYQKYKQSGGCPANCGRLSNDSDLLEKQFQLLSAISTQKNCTISDTMSSDIKKDFILFTGAVGNKFSISGLNINGLTCGLKTIESDGFDASLSNFYYKTGFLYEDKIIDIRFILFPNSAFPSVSALWESFGFGASSRLCNASCYEKELAYMNNFSLTNPPVNEVIHVYDQMLSTFQFLPED